MSEQDKTKDTDAGELHNDQLESVAGGVTGGGCIPQPITHPWDPPIEIDPTFPPFQTE